MPVRLLQGTADADVPMEDALRLLSHAEGPDIRLALVKDADHRFSGPRRPKRSMLRTAVKKVIKALDANDAAGAEAAFAGDGVEVLAPASLLALVNHVKGQQVMARPAATLRAQPFRGPDLKEVRGQAAADPDQGHPQEGPKQGLRRDALPEVGRVRLGKYCVRRHVGHTRA